MKTDPSDEIYRIMDKAGLDATTILAARQSMTKTVNQIRMKIAKDLKVYIENREAPAKRIEVTEEPEPPM